MKIRWDGHLATKVYMYVDYGRATGFCREICWAACRQVASTCTKLGVQEKAEKRTFLTPTQGTWAGTVTHTDRGEITGLVSDEKWAKTKAQILELDTLVQEAEAAGREHGRARPSVLAMYNAQGYPRYT